MSKERLSRLQKWILVEAYKKGKRDAISCPNEDIKNGLIKAGLGYCFNAYWIGTDEIYRRYFGIEKSGRDAKSVKSVILCRSTKKLKEREYFEAWRYEYFEDRYEQRLILSAKGIDKAKSIITSQNARDYTIRR